MDPTLMGMAPGMAQGGMGQQPQQPIDPTGGQMDPAMMQALIQALMQGGVQQQPGDVGSMAPYDGIPHVPATQ